MTSRGDRRFVTGLVVAAAAIVLLVPTQASACSCALELSPCAAGAGSVIFVGTPVAVEHFRSANGTALVRFHFDVEDPIQNIDGMTADVTTLPSAAECGFPFETGVKYLVYASGTSGTYSASLCSRTGRFEARQDDLEILRDTSVLPRLFGGIDRLQLRLNGQLADRFEIGGISNVPVRITDRGKIREMRTDANGRFWFDRVSPGTYVVDAQLPAPYAPLFKKPVTATVDGCSGEAVIPVTTVPLRGTVHAAGSASGHQVMLRFALVGSDRRVSIDRSTLVFTDRTGAWSVPGLPAGQYLVGVSVFDPPTKDTPYSPSWYPNASRPEDATLIVVADDRTVSIDFRLPRRIPEITISGRTVGPDGTLIAKVDISLIDRDAGKSLETVAFATSDDAGHFSIPGLLGRRYRLRGMEVRQGGAKSEVIDLILTKR
jgi:hypothetical protein